VVNIVGVGSDEDRRNRVTRLNEVQCPPSTPIRTSNAVPWNGSVGSDRVMRSSQLKDRKGRQRNGCLLGI
jgi:hypothetical protein